MLLNEHLLSIAGASWHQPYLLRPDWEEKDTLAHLSSLRSRLDYHLSTQQWIDKDPRLCLTRDAVAHILLTDIPAIAILRHPVEVAQSLYLRNGFAPAKSLLIWLLYNYHLYNCSSSLPHYTLLHADLVSTDLEHRNSCSVLLEDFLQQTFPQNSTSLSSQISACLDRGLLHCNAGSTHQLGLDAATTQFFNALWQDIGTEVRQHQGRALATAFSAALPQGLSHLLPGQRTPVYGHHIAHQRECLERRLQQTENALHTTQIKAQDLEQTLQGMRSSRLYRLSQAGRRLWRRLWRPRVGADHS